MCLVKKAPVIDPAMFAPKETEVVERHQADASLTKSSVDEAAHGYKENLRTTPLGLEDNAQTQKKTLLGE